jgi:hypothetical protein
MSGVFADTATLLPNGKVLITASDPEQPKQLSYTDIYDPSTGVFTPTGSMISGHTSPTATLLMIGKVLIAGGVPVGGGSDNLASAEIYNPVTGTFSPTGSMLIWRDWLDATLLNDGQVLITGGNECYPCCAGGRDAHPNLPMHRFKFWAFPRQRMLVILSRTRYGPISDPGETSTRA